MAQIPLTVNGKAVRVTVDPATPLLYVLRNDLELNSPRFGCGLAQCGACSVLVGGQEMRSCVLPVGRVDGEIVTLEGLGSRDRLHPLQRAFIAEQACQCGYCGSGMVMAAKALLDKNPRPTPAQIRQALNGHLCRCASHNRIVRAVERAAGELRAGFDGDPIAADAHPVATVAHPAGAGTAGGPA
jgi:aerobic-type carbon monoxide dehydrogenase small subunit (CoxS/CutS family)